MRVQVTKYNVSLFSAPECLLYKSLGAVQAVFLTLQTYGFIFFSASKK